jgi:hypothetical protein
MSDVHSHVVASDDDPDEFTLWLMHPESDSAATIHTTPGATHHPIRERGPRSLVTEALAAHAWWERASRPARTRLGLSVAPDGQRAWLDHPGDLLPDELGARDH